MTSITDFPELEVEYWDLVDKYSKRALANVGLPEGFETQEEAQKEIKAYKERLAARLIEKAKGPKETQPQNIIHDSVVNSFHRNQLYETKPYLRKVDQAKEERAKLIGIFEKNHNSAIDELKCRTATEASSITNRRLTKTEFYILQILLFGEDVDRFIAAYQILSKTASDRIFAHNVCIVDAMGTMDIFGPHIESLDTPLMPNLPEFTAINNDALHRARSQPLVGNGKTNVIKTPSTVFDDPPTSKTFTTIKAVLENPIWSSPEMTELSGAGFIPLTQDASGGYGFNTTEVEQAFYKIHQRVEALSKLLRGNAYSALKATAVPGMNNGGRGRGGRGRGNQQHQAQAQQNSHQQQQLQQNHQQQVHQQQQPAPAPPAVF